MSDASVDARSVSASARLGCVLSMASCVSIFGISPMFNSSGRPESAGDWLTMLLVVATAISLAITVEKSDEAVRLWAGLAAIGALGVLVAWFLMFHKPEEKYGVPIGAVGIWFVGLFFMVMFSLAAWFAAWRKSTKRDWTEPV